MHIVFLHQVLTSLLHLYRILTLTKSYYISRMVFTLGHRISSKFHLDWRMIRSVTWSYTCSFYASQQFFRRKKIVQTPLFSCITLSLQGSTNSWTVIISFTLFLDLGRFTIVNYGQKSCVALPAHPFIQPTILSLADSHLALMGVHTLITSSDSHADIEEI